MHKNLCLRYLESIGEDLDNYWCYCDTLANEVIDWATQREGLNVDGLWIKRANGYLYPKSLCRTKHKETTWVYHAVVLYRGRVHDPWFPKLLHVPTYLSRNFPSAKRILLSSLWSKEDDQKVAINEEGRFRIY